LSQYAATEIKMTWKNSKSVSVIKTKRGIKNQHSNNQRYVKGCCPWRGFTL